MPSVPAAMKETGNQTHTAWLLDTALPLKVVSPAAPLHFTGGWEGRGTAHSPGQRQA